VLIHRPKGQSSTVMYVAFRCPERTTLHSNYYADMIHGLVLDQTIEEDDVPCLSLRDFSQTQSLRAILDTLPNPDSVVTHPLQEAG
jgi:hypothetical protein